MDATEISVSAKRNSEIEKCVRRQIKNWMAALERYNTEITNGMSERYWLSRKVYFDNMENSREAPGL